MPNLLYLESSPYLLQHASNPVHWLAWNTSTLELAKKKQKLLLVSIGYSACHWCHVMEQESFENETIAELLNQNYISIKVDREERPDIDQVYMDAALLLTGRGGWPLNVICLPSGEPIFAGTYFRPAQLKHILQQFAQAWQNEPSELSTYAHQIGQKANALNFLAKSNENEINVAIQPILTDWLQLVDWRFGGQKGAPKFPIPCNLSFLLTAGALFNDERAKDFVLFTLEQIIKGGITDQIGGGFSRYSVDEEWHVPHFEKMLYDNAQLLSLCAKAYKISGENIFKATVTATADFLLREMKQPLAGFAAAYDADSEGEEGKFYVFSDSEFNELLLENSQIVKDYYDIRPEGNWEGKNVLRVVKSLTQLAKRYHLSEQEIQQRIKRARQQLFTYREKRPKPALDDKQLTSWNALTIIGFCDAYTALGNPEYLKAAVDTASFYASAIRQNNGIVYRNYKNEEWSIPAFLDDFAFLTQAFIALYQITFQEKWLTLAGELIQECQQHFYDEQTSLFFYTNRKSAPLIIDKKEMNDNVIPSSNAAMFTAIFTYAQLMGDVSLEDFVRKTLTTYQHSFAADGRNYAHWLTLITLLQTQPKQVAIVGKQAHNIALQLQQHYLPNTVFLGSTKANMGTVIPTLQNKFQQDKTLIYCCENHTCSSPVETVEEALQLLKS